MHIHQERIEDADREAVSFGDDAQQQVLGADVIMTQPAGFLAALVNDLLDIG